MSLIHFKSKCCDPLTTCEDKSWALDAFPSFARDWYPAVDINEDAQQIVLKADLPGLNKDNIQVSLEGTLLSIKGERKSEEEAKEKNFYRIERSYGAFERIFDLGVVVDENKIKASYHNGVLEVIVPKPEHKAGHKIAIEDKGKSE
jgi:HSP20 family protein